MGVVLLMSEVRREWADWLEMIKRQQYLKYPRISYNQSCRISYEWSTRPALKQVDYSSRRPHWIPTLSDKNRKMTVMGPTAAQGACSLRTTAFWEVKEPSFEFQKSPHKFVNKKWRAIWEPKTSTLFGELIQVLRTKYNWGWDLHRLTNMEQ